MELDHHRPQRGRQAAVIGQKIQTGHFEQMERALRALRALRGLAAPAQPAVPPPGNTAHRADQMVSAGRIFRAAMRTGKDFGWYRAYRHWCQLEHRHPVSLKRFIVTLERQRRIRSRRKGYWDGRRTTNPRSVLLFGCQAPPGMVESAWLGPQIARMQSALREWMAEQRATEGMAWAA